MATDCQDISVEIVEEIIEVELVEEIIQLDIVEEIIQIDIIEETILVDMAPEVIDVEVVVEEILVEVEAWCNPLVGSASGYYETFYGSNSKMKGRYLSYAGKLSNKVGLPIIFNGMLTGVAVQTELPCSGWVRIKQNGALLYSVQMTNQNSKILTGISKALLAGESLSVSIESVNGMSNPTVRLYMT